MNNYIAFAKNYIFEHKRQFKTGVIFVAGTGVVVLFVALFAYNNQSKLPTIVYTPVSACDLLTKSEAEKLLGGDVIPNSTEQTIDGDTAKSKCSYSDTNADNFRVAAVAVRSGINDAGVSKNKQDFAASKKANTTELVTGVGDDAFFNKTNGQLNILTAKTWLILNFGLTSDVTSHSIEDAIKLANKVIEYKMLDSNEVTF